MSLFTSSKRMRHRDTETRRRNEMAMNLAYASRRDFLRRTGGGFGLTALSALLADQGLLRAAGTSIGNSQSAIGNPINPLAPKTPHFAAKEKSVIWLFMNGGQSQVDTWDYKP